MREKFPLQIVRTKEQFKAVTSLHIVFDKSRDIRRELDYIEQDYTILVKTIRDIIALQGKRRDPRLYWLVGDSILRFLNRLDDIGFYLMHQNDTLERDIGMEGSVIRRIIAFRKRFPRISMVNSTISWSKYKDNKVAVPNCREINE